MISHGEFFNLENGKMHGLGRLMHKTFVYIYM
jgi:hypothetical protein